MPKILITSTSFGKKYKPPLEELRSKGYELKLNDLGRPMQPDELIERLADCEGCIAGLDHYTADVLQACGIGASGRLRIIARYGAGIDRVDLAAAAETGVTVTNTPTANSDSVADLAVGLMLAVARRIPMAHRSVCAGEWKNMYGVSLARKTVGLIGFGRIGRRVAERVRGFRCDVLVYDPFVEPEAVEQIGARAVSLDELLASADFISLHLPASDETARFLNAERFARMNPSAILVNTSRGEVIDQPALINALRTGQIRGAGLDAHAEEPPDVKAYEGLDNVVLTPHIGAYTEDALINMATGSVENLCAFFEDREPPNVVA
ncbi:MAG: phosphoglycerate dehydrogenase [Candidatus Nealsonbacteria bacterium]|nr:phosphoglycerate dehydrogenase [Candidatus Nealsonbacteria bacterium]